MSRFFKSEFQQAVIGGLVMMIGVMVMLLLAIAVELWQTLEPCPMCEMQRHFLASIYLLVGIGLMLQTTGNLVGVIVKHLIRIFLFLGLVLALRQTYLQFNPELVGDNCLPSLSMIYSLGGWHEIFRVFWYGSSQCAEIEFVFLGLTIPGWLALGYLMLIGCWNSFSTKFNH